MKAKVLKIIICTLCLFIVLSTSASASIGQTNYVVDNRGRISIPVCYTAEKRIESFYEGSFMNTPKNMYIDDEDNLYIADSGNNRIVKLDSNLEFIAEFSAEKTLNQPNGAFYSTKENLLYIADTENERIAVVDYNDKLVKEYFKPNSELLEQTMHFNPSNIALGKQGYLYILKGQNFMQLNKAGEFKGFIGSTKVGASFLTWFIRRFATKKQKDQLVTDQPRTYYNFTMDNDGVIYAVASTNTAQIRKINMVGDNIYPEKFYGEKVENISGELVDPNFISIAVADDGVISVLEENSKRIYQYSQDGTMLNVFGGEGEVLGFFTTPVSIVTDSEGSIYVADSSQNSITKFKRTAYATSIYKAQTAYEKGCYEEAYEFYKEASLLNPNYSVLNTGMAKCLYKMGKTAQAAEAYRAADDRSGYGSMLYELRTEIMKENFALICLAIVVVVAILIALIKYLKKYSDKVVRKYYHLDE